MRPAGIAWLILLVSCAGSATAPSRPDEADARAPDARVRDPGPTEGTSSDTPPSQPDPGADAEGDARAAPDLGSELPGDVAAAADPGPMPCPAGLICVAALPFHDEGDTSAEPPGAFADYACAPGTDEGGAEVIYRVALSRSGFLSVAVYDGPGVDVDAHILSSLDPASCLARGDLGAAADLPAGLAYVVIDTFVSAGTPRAGAYAVEIGFTEPSVGPCAMQTGEMARVGDGGDHLAMPATGPIVREAHLVTQEEPAPFPSTSTEELDAHYALSQAATGFIMHRREPWAPLEGGSHYGAGIGSPSLLPVLDEGWYVNMFWTARARPSRGTRMILRQPGSDRAVVVAAGYETGPGNLAHIGGTTEEAHFYLGTGHLDVLTLGLAADPSLPLGPRRCTD